MVQEDLGAATIVYEGPDGEPIEREVDNEHVAYFQDHWIVKTDDGEAEHDTVRRIPNQRVYYVERDVEAFEEEVKTVVDEFQSVAGGVEQELRTVRDRIGSIADDMQSGLFGGGGRRTERSGGEVHEIEVDAGSGDSGSGFGSTEGGDGSGEPDDQEGGLE